ncbi:MAG: DinB family protein [Anaerolineales bacterium]|nr:DinB family protein [Anaerolineales bacterium]
MTPINSKLEIISAIKDSGLRAQNWFLAIPAKDFFHREGEAWSASDNVDHMIKAIKPVAKALGLPKLALQTMFAKPENPSRTYNEICSVYRAEIAKGAQASGTFLPDQTPPANPEEKKEELLSQLGNVMERLIAAVEKWDDKDLEEAQLPHPILGKLTLREMLYFTIYHNLRHASLEGD